MRYLVAVSLIWAFSFGLIKTYLTGLDPLFVGAARLGVALLVFLPFFRIKQLTPGLITRFLLIGGIQYGLMYGSYIYTYQFLEAHKIALFTVTTPILVALLDDSFEGRFRVRYLVFAFVSVLGAIIIYFNSPDLEVALIGILLLQISNLCFAFGQVFYRRIIRLNTGLKMREHFGVLYLGGFVVSVLLMVIGTDWERTAVTGTQAIVILFLGILASGVGFFLWNYGATKTNAGTLAILNNLKIPLAVIVSLVFFETVSADALIRLLIGGGIIVGAVVLNERLMNHETDESR
ncbi:MAG: EamA family transporter [Verrucomicrobia bacterium]|nr:EamA family transporter [Verrucomicrobiota bacterium]MDA1068317.1 EamA family transporter [Verrucomicrobiota bacterium]